MGVRAWVKLNALLRLTVMTLEVLDYLVHRSVSLFEVSGVGGIAPALHSESLDLLYRILEIVVFLEVGECDVRSGRGQFHGDGLAYAACGTCNKGDLTL